MSERDANDPNWARVLDAFYEHGLQVKNPDHVKDALAEISGHTDLDPIEIREEINYLRDVGLLTPLAGGGLCHLTEEGFQVAHERAQTNREQRTNMRIAALTVVLGLAAIVQAMAAAFQLQNQLYSYGLAGSAVLLAVIVWYVGPDADQLGQLSS